MGQEPYDPPRRKLSAWRVAVAALVVAVAVAGTVKLVTRTTSAKAATPVTAPWFAPYVDTTLTPTSQFQIPSSNVAHSVVLGFVVADPTSACTPSWGGAYSLDQAEQSLSLDNRIARYRQLHGDVMVSFGGQANQELATTCTSVDGLTYAYLGVVNRYQLTTVDFDIEGATLTDTAALSRRADAVHNVQKTVRAAGGHLAVWLTLPASPTGLNAAGVQVVQSMLDAHVDLAGVNLMTMDFGSSKPTSTSMIDAVEQSLTAGQQQVQAAYPQAGDQLTTAQAWNKVGATPMIGQNDTADETFTTSDAQQLVNFADARGMGRLSFWSLNRDMPCGPNDPNPGQAANNCSGLAQQPLAFSAVFNQLTGRSASAASAVTDATAAPTGPDNPLTSPYPIWETGGSYPAGTKVVWKHTIYQAKWWNQGQAPNTPVTGASATPWLLIGPVLSGQNAVTNTTVPSGTYPAWSASSVYPAGSHVVYRGIGYQAKWWNQGVTPDASDPGGSAWAAMS